MDEDGLPLMGSGIDLTKQDNTQDSGPQESEASSENVLTVAKDPRYARYLKMVQVKLADLSLRIQQIETTLNILDAKLSSIPGLEDVTVEVSPLSVTAVPNESHSESTAEQPQGVPVMAIRNKMISEGLDPDLLEKPDAPVPNGASEKAIEESSDSESSFSD
ncbi:WASH complex subunit CCDC53-like protein [Cricetulus griseus]|uniref:WASH complex subunit 3 n=1 Tax=Cricetulus griseus TaxID=10029 RepID=A0A061IQF9_CRIGR|nr:WASH complex subunit CCDC53-like protein [Cricetulus griseus]